MALLGLGMATGLVAGLLGIGGGMLMVPFLTILFTQFQFPDAYILHMAIERGAVILAVCTGFQIIGNRFFASGQEVEGLGLLDVTTVPGDKRLVGDIKTTSNVLGFELTGFENHTGRTILGPTAQAFGKVIKGHGNGDSKYDGAVNGNIFGTYMHGPILARNPEFADLLLTRATGRKYAQITDPLALKYATWRRKVI